MSAITHIPHFPVLFEKIYIFLKSFDKSWNSVDRKIEKKIGF
jgi:hypothetical protein